MVRYLAFWAQSHIRTSKLQVSSWVGLCEGAAPKPSRLSKQDLKNNQILLFKRLIKCCAAVFRRSEFLDQEKLFLCNSRSKKPCYIVGWPSYILSIHSLMPRHDYPPSRTCCNCVRHRVPIGSREFCIAFFFINH